MDFVSRGGLKLDFGLDAFGIDASGRICADLGCSTGGFTDVMLQRGALRVYAVDTGYGVLEWKLRQDDRVVVMERTNALHVQLPEMVSLISIDASWTRQAKIIPHALTLLEPGGDIVTLIKPHYEAPKAWLRKGVLPPERHAEVLDKVLGELRDLGCRPSEPVQSPIAGGKGKNLEYLVRV